MTTSRPLVISGGRTKELPLGDNLAGVVLSASGVLNFGTTDNGDATVFIPATWSGSCSFSYTVGVNTSDHDIEDIILEGILVNITESAGVGFNVYAHAPNGTWGRYTVTVLGWN